MTTLTDEYLTDLFGPKCPDCGWRRGHHRPAGLLLTACPRLADTAKEEAKP